MSCVFSCKSNSLSFELGNDLLWYKANVVPRFPHPLPFFPSLGAGDGVRGSHKKANRPFLQMRRPFWFLLFQIAIMRCPGGKYILICPWTSHNVFRNKRNQNGRRICKKVYYGFVNRLFQQGETPWNDFCNHDMKFHIYGLWNGHEMEVRMIIAVGGAIGLNHTAAILSHEGLKTFVFVHQNSFPNISTRGSGYEIYCLWPIWPPPE